MLVTSSEKTNATDAIKATKPESLVTQVKERTPNQAINKVAAKQEQVDVLSRWSCARQAKPSISTSRI